MNQYHNPHPAMPMNHGQRPIHHPQPHGYGAPVNYGNQQPQAPQQVPYWMENQPGYQQGQPMNNPQASPVQIINTPQGPMMMDTRNGTILGPVQNQPQQMVQGRPPQYNQPFQGQMNPTPQITSNNDVSSSYIDNRYGNAGSLIKPKGTDNQQVVKPVIDVQTKETQMKPVIKKPTLSTVTGYIPTYHNKALTETDAVVKNTNLVGSTLEHLVFEVIEEAHSADDTHLLWVQSGVVIQTFYKTTLMDKDSELYQTNIEKVYRAAKKIAPTISSVEDFVYFQEYNKWMTRCINTFLATHMSDTLIDSFFDDFNELTMFLIADYDHIRELLAEHMAGILEQALCTIEELRGVLSEEDAAIVSESQCVIPEELTVIYVKLYSGEMGDDGSDAGLKVATKIMASLKEISGKANFIMVTMDRRFYRVTVMNDGDVTVDCIRE